jgi:DNA-binding transcriptional ArsR family regulator
MLVCSPMSRKASPPDYDLADRLALTMPSQVKALSHPLRTTILSLLHERAATVTELAVAVGRPKSTVAHHVRVLTEAGLLQVVRTRRVRAIVERFYGRTARKLWGFIRHARISEAQVSELWERMAELVTEFDQLPRSGETVYGFAIGVYPTDHPTLPGSDN